MAEECQATTVGTEEGRTAGGRRARTSTSSPSFRPPTRACPPPLPTPPPSPRSPPAPLEGPHRAGRIDDHAGARAQPLHRQPAADAVAKDQRGLPRDEALPATDAEADPRRIRQRGLLRQARVRRASGGADVL